MRAAPVRPRTARERLRWITRYSLPRLRQVSGPKYYLIVLALLCLLAALIVIGGFVGIAASDVFRAYAQSIKELIGAAGS